MSSGVNQIASMEKSGDRNRIAVAMSGGIDSSVAAALLLEEGYEVVGITMSIAGGAIRDSFERAGHDAAGVAQALGIPHFVVDFGEAFRKLILDDFVDNYRRGRTPNPCPRCNALIKFGLLLDKACELGASHIATGHYARVVYDRKRRRWLLKRAVDKAKDQSYVLYGLSQEQLSASVMPLGELTKDEVRGLASRLDLPSANKSESQDICFTGSGGYANFIKQVAPDTIRPGPILNTAGQAIGHHKGIAFYTVGQRKGIGIPADRPLYVTAIVPEQNAIIVGGVEELYGTRLIASGLNYISVETVTVPLAVTAKVRYNIKDARATLLPLSDCQAEVIFEQPQRAITPGQAVVFYDGEEVLGGGVIDRASDYCQGGG